MPSKALLLGYYKCERNKDGKWLRAGLALRKDETCVVAMDADLDKEGPLPDTLLGRWSVIETESATSAQVSIQWGRTAKQRLGAGWTFEWTPGFLTDDATHRFLGPKGEPGSEIKGDVPPTDYGKRKDITKPKKELCCIMG